MVAQVPAHTMTAKGRLFWIKPVTWFAVLAILIDVMIVASALAETQGQGILLSQDGVAQCTIVVPQESSPKELELASELAHWLKEMTGATFDVSRGLRDQAIILGTWDEWRTLLSADMEPPKGPEGYRIRSDRKNLWIIARSELGLQHAIYDFLECLGCRWYFPDPVWTVIPRVPTLVIQLDRTAVPAFGYRRIWYGWGPRTDKLARDYQDWLKHNRQLGSFAVSCGHSYDSHIPPSQFAEHPEWFAYVNGRRQPSQLCTSHPEVQKRVIEHVLEVFRKNPAANMVSVEPNDGDGYCECEACLKLGTPSDRVFHLANVVAEAVRRKFPDKWVGLYAYAGHSEPPHFALKPGVYVQVTTGFRYTKLTFEEQVEAFRKLGAAVGVYDYFSVYPWDWDMPGAAKASRVFELAAAIRHYHELGLTTYDAESSCNWGPNGLGYWMAAHLMWDPNLDPETLFQDFCDRAFGPASQHVARIYRRWADGERLSPRQLKLALLDLQQAYASTDDPTIRQRLDRIAMYLHWLRLWSDYDRSARWNQWGRLAVAPSETILRHAEQFVRYTRRIMDTGLVHSYPALHSEWFRHRLAALAKIPGFDWEQTKAWMRDDRLPTAEEISQDFHEDLRGLQEVQAVELKKMRFEHNLVPLAARQPALVAEWQKVAPSNVAVESGVFVFRADKTEALSLEYRPYDTGHTIDCNWKLCRWPDISHPLVNGHVKAAKGEKGPVEINVPGPGLFAFDPGTAYWRAAEIGFDHRPLSLWAGRPKDDTKGFPPLRLWRPRLDQPLYLFVPKGTSDLVIGIVEGGDPYTVIQVKTSKGTVLCQERLLAGDQLCVSVNPQARDRDDPTDEDKAIRGGKVLSVGFDSLRCVIEIYNVPPYLARHPSELLVPVDAM